VARLVLKTNSSDRPTATREAVKNVAAYCENAPPADAEYVKTLRAYNIAGKALSLIDNVKARTVKKAEARKELVNIRDDATHAFKELGHPEYAFEMEYVIKPSGTLRARKNVDNDDAIVQQEASGISTEQKTYVTGLPPEIKQDMQRLVEQYKENNERTKKEFNYKNMPQANGIFLGLKNEPDAAKRQRMVAEAVNWARVNNVLSRAKEVTDDYEQESHSPKQVGDVLYRIRALKATGTLTEDQEKALEKDEARLTGFREKNTETNRVFLDSQAIPDEKKDKIRLEMKEKLYADNRLFTLGDNPEVTDPLMYKRFYKQVAEKMGLWKEAG